MLTALKWGKVIEEWVRMCTALKWGKVIEEWVRMLTALKFILNAHSTTVTSRVCFYGSIITWLLSNILCLPYRYDNAS